MTYFVLNGFQRAMSRTKFTLDITSGPYSGSRACGASLSQPVCFACRFHTSDVRTAVRRSYYGKYLSKSAAVK